MRFLVDCIDLFAILVCLIVIPEYCLSLKEADLHIAVLVPKKESDGGCTKKAIEMAVTDINRDPERIVNPRLNTTYRLTPSFAETGQDDGNAIEAMYSLYHNKDKHIMLSTVGPPYKDQNEYCTEFSTANANVHISYSEANEPMESYYVFWYQTPPSIVSSFMAARSLMDHFNWTRMAIIYDYSDKRYRKNSDNLRAIMNKKKVLNATKSITILADQGIWSQPAQYKVSGELKSVQEQGARIIFTLVSVSGARKVFCEAYHRKMYAPKVIWIMFEILPSDWATDRYNSLYDKANKRYVREISCTETQLHHAARGYISITKHGLRKDGVKAIGNMTSDEFRNRLKKEMNGATCSEDVAYAYDALWVTALAHKSFSISPTTFVYSFYKYQWFPVALQLRDHVRGLKFQGLTGPISYKTQLHNIWNRIGRLAIWSNGRTGEPIYAGKHDTSTDVLSLVPEYSKILFEDSNAPKDEASYVTVFSDFKKPLLITMWIVAGIGVILAICFLIAIFVFSQDNRVVFSSPYINCIIILGSIMCYAAVMIYGVDTRFVSKDGIVTVCWSFLVTLSIGFTLTFGSLFAKAWQLYKMYMTPEVKVADNQLQVKKVSEWSLAIIIAIFLAIDVAILGCWGKFSPFEYEVRNITSDENLFDDTITIEQIVGCSCKYETEFTIGVYCYKGVMLIFGIFIAWQTRHAKIKIQNESKQIAMAIYNVVAVSLIGVICVSVLANTTRQQALYAIVAVCITICTTTTLLLVFLPKIRNILNADSMTINSNSEASSANEAAPEKFSIGYMRKSMERKTVDTKLTVSTGTLSTQMSTEQTQVPNSVEPDMVNFTSGSTPPFAPPSYLSNSSFMPQPPPIYEEVEQNSKVDVMGRLNSGVYVGRSEENVDSKTPDYENAIEEHQENPLPEVSTEYDDVDECKA